MSASQTDSSTQTEDRLLFLVTPMNPKCSEDYNPQSVNHITMDQQMFHHLPFTMAHATPTKKWETMLNKIITSKNLPPRIVQTKNDTFLGSLTYQTLTVGTS